MKIVVERTDEGVTLTVDGKLIDPAKSQAVQNHSPTGFEYGYSGSGPAQLALAILLEVFEEDYALKNYLKFKEKVIAEVPKDRNRWELNYSRMDFVRGLRKLDKMAKDAKSTKKNRTVLGK